jgi:8-oxo-dGTP diphosphatase
MDTSVQLVHDLVNSIQPYDKLEAEHRADVLGWLETTNDVFRRAKPAEPERHLVSYVVMVDPDDNSTLLVDHINAGLWLPPGGHVEPGEHPTATARREAREELGIGPVLIEPSDRPSFVTVTRTGGIDAGHTDVSLWFILVGYRGMDLTLDVTEFNEARWWSPADVHTADANSFDPHYLRFAEKMWHSQTCGGTGLGAIQQHRLHRQGDPPDGRFWDADGESRSPSPAVSIMNGFGARPSTVDRLRAFRRLAVALLGGLSAGSEHGSDLIPRVAMLTGCGHGISYLDLARSGSADGGADTAQTTGVGIRQGDGRRVE